MIGACQYRKRYSFFLMIAAFLLAAGTIFMSTDNINEVVAQGAVKADNIPKWSGAAYVEINDGMPMFSERKKECTEDYVKYSPLDGLGRAGRATGCLGLKTISDSGREGIGNIRPSGWETKKYPELIKDRYVYNRCHLLMRAAASGMDESTCNSEKNLITGTRYMNVDGMLPYESELLSYLRSTGNHVLYRVTPVYKGIEPVARGVQLEGWSVEDGGRGLKFNVFCYNIQPGIAIDYATGKTRKKENAKLQEEIAWALANGAMTVTATEVSLPATGNGSDASKSAGNSRTALYVLNNNTKRFHYPDCPSVNQILEKNKEIGHFTRDELTGRGYVPCGNCKP